MAAGVNSDWIQVNDQLLEQLARLQVQFARLRNRLIELPDEITQHVALMLDLHTSKMEQMALRMASTSNPIESKPDAEVDEDEESESAQVYDHQEQDEYSETGYKDDQDFSDLSDHDSLD